MTTTTQMTTRRAPSYVGLAVVSIILRILGWFGVILAVVGIAMSANSISQGASGEQSGYIFGFPKLAISIAGLISALFIVGFGEVFAALRDIARNSFGSD